MWLARVRRAGKLKLSIYLLVFAAAATFNVWLALSIANTQPGDSKAYSQLAVNLLEQRVFSTESKPPYSPTLIRTPGYPLFLAAVYETFGMRNDTAVRVVQALLYLLTAIFAGMIATKWIEDSRRKSKAAWITFVLAAFCPFTANYSSVVLTETLTMFLLAAVVLAATYALKSRRKIRSHVWWGLAGLISGVTVLVRPDAGLFAFGLGLTLVVSVFFGRGRFSTRFIDRFLKGLVFSALFILPLVPWTIRNERVFGFFQPLSPAHGEMPGEFVSRGYFLWLRTWVDDGQYIDPLIWRVGIKRLRIEDVPLSAFSSDDERQNVTELFDQYNNSDPEHPFKKPKPADNTKSDNKPDNNSNGDDDSNNCDEPNSGDDQNADQDNSDNQDDNSDDSSDSEGELNLSISPDMDNVFAEIGNARIEREPWHYYLWLPLKRSESMWFDNHADFYPFAGTLFPLSKLDESINQHIWLPIFAVIVWVYTILAFGGLFVLGFARKARAFLWLFMVLAISIPRALFFGTLENPEPRYLIELFIPAAILGGLFLSCLRIGRRAASLAIEMRWTDPPIDD